MLSVDKASTIEPYRLFGGDNCRFGLMAVKSMGWLTVALLLALVQVPQCVGLTSSGEDGRVLVEMYSESLCPYCKNFIVNYLSKFFENGLINIVELRIIPYGNAHIHEGGSIVCQHGEDECRLNVIQTCAINLWPDVFKWFPFVYCLEALDKQIAYAQWTSCVGPSGLDLARILECFQGPLGLQLELANAKETDSLDPPHRYVPWVLVKGTPLMDEYLHVEKFVCEAYDGPEPKPQVCSDVQWSVTRAKRNEAGFCLGDPELHVHPQDSSVQRSWVL